MRRQYRYTTRRTRVKFNQRVGYYRRLERMKQESKAAKNTQHETATDMRAQVATGHKDFSRASGYKIQKGADLRGIDLRHADLSGQVLENVKIDRAQGADFSFATIKGGSLSGGFAGASLRGARLTDVTAAGAGMAHVDASGLTATGTSFAGIQAHGINLNGAHLNAANLCAADLSGGSLRRAIITYSVAEDANFTRSKISANIRDVSFDRSAFNNAIVIMKKSHDDHELSGSFHGADFSGRDTKVNDQVLAAGGRDHARGLETVQLIADTALEETPDEAPAAEEAPRPQAGGRRRQAQTYRAMDRTTSAPARAPNRRPSPARVAAPMHRVA